MARCESIDTPWGRLDILLPTHERIEPLIVAWPFELAAFTDPADRENARAEFLLPFAGREGALPGAYMAHLPGPQTDALARVAITRRVLARAVGAIAAARHEGGILVCATLRDEGGGVATSGVGLFALPLGADRSLPTRDELEASFQARLGPGGGALLGTALRAISAVETPPLPEVTGVKLAAAPYMGKRWLDFLVLGGRVYCLQDQVDPTEPVWTDLADGGVREMVHMPVGGATPQLGLPRMVPRGEGVLSAGGARRVYRLLCHIAAVDGAIDPRERVVLDDYCGRLGIQREDAGRLMQEGVTGKAIEVGPTQLERSLLLEGLLDVAAADGVLAPEEESMLAQFAEAVGLPLGVLHHALRTRFADLTPPAAPSTSEPDSEAPATSVVDRVGPDGIRRVYRLLWNLASCDGAVDPLEEAFLEAFRERYAIGIEEGAALAAQGARGEQLRIGSGVPERALLVETSIALAAADGVLAPQEEQQLATLTAQLGIPPELLARALAERFPPEPQPEPEPREETRAAPSEPGRVILLDLPHDVVAVDLHKIPLGDSRGFRGVPPGVHRFAVPDARGEVSCWVSLGPGEVVTLGYDGRRLHPVEAGRTARFAELAQGGSLEDALLDFPLHLHWQLLTRPLAAVDFPPTLHPVRLDPAPERLEQEWLRVHHGNSRGFLAEFSWAFLVGLFADDPSGFERWLHLLQAIYHVGPRLPQGDPTLFGALVELMIAQQQLLPSEMLTVDSPVVAHARLLAEALVTTDVPLLIEAGKHFAVFCAGNHRVDLRPADQATDPASTRVSNLERAVREVEAEGGPDDPRLLELLFELGRLQEQLGQLSGSLAAQERLLVLAAANGASPIDLARGYKRLAHLFTKAGKPREAQLAMKTALNQLRAGYRA